MKNRQSIRLIITFFLIFSIFSSVFPIITQSFLDLHRKNYNIVNEYSNNPKLANPSLNYSSIILNRTKVYRLFETITISVNASGYKDVNYTFMELSFNNGTVSNFTMTSAGNNLFYFEYTPRYNAPLGLQNVSFYIFNESDTILNAHTTYSNFTIRTNYWMNITNNEYYIGDTLYAELGLVNISGFDFRWWNITVVDSTDEQTQNNLYNLERNLYQFTLKITNETFSQVNKIYYIKVNITSDNGKTYATYFPFEIINSKPNIIRDSILFSPEEVFRSEECTISLNVTDIESEPESLSISSTIEDPTGRTLPLVSLSHEENESYQGTFTIPADYELGKYYVNISAKDPNGGSDSTLTFFTVKNNMPEIHSYKINGRSSNESISILYGKNFVFTFNVSDVEGIAFIKVALLGENNNWFNITRFYNANSTKITIRSVDLISGIWYVYIYVIDTDGAITSLIDDYDMAPQAITIIPDVISAYIPWITFSIGLILGILASIGITYKYFKSKFIESKETKPKKTKQVIKTAITEKKEKERQVKGEIKEEAKGLEEKEEKEKIPKRKIKRKL
ncbi:MAG: hypothetical protein ACFFHD_01175 [Promethearchaeota archaeon]